MRHNPNSAVYNGAYINERVPFDVLSAVLERPSANGILRMLTHMSLMRDPRAPVHVPDDVLAALPPDPSIMALEEERAKLKAGAFRIQGTEVEPEVRRLNLAISAAKKKRRNDLSAEYRADYFRRRPTMDIDMQNNGEMEEEYIESVVDHQIPERTQLAELLCTKGELKYPEGPVQRRIQAAELMLTLCHRREVARRYRLQRKPPAQRFVKEESPEETPPFVFPLICGRTQCIFCIGDDSKSYEDRMSSFCRPNKMMNHVEGQHLKARDPQARIRCEHPICRSAGLVLNNVSHFKNHVETVHRITLRVPRYVTS